jgi:glycosyltransferase involved in cell wall biosynthesis
MSAAPEIPVTLAICSNRPERFAVVVARISPLLGSQDFLLIIADTRADQIPEQVIRTAPFESRARLLCNGQNLGLAHSRNKALKETTTRHLIFLDDDIRPTAQALQGLRGALAAGAGIVGTRIDADLQGRTAPWFLTPGQLHYLGSHDPAQPASIWGGSFGIDVEQALMLGISFDENLGRVGDDLASAEDTTFVRALTAQGVRREILHHVHARHLIDPSRLTLAYLLRRAFWQGRSEVRRHDTRHGISKEWQRNRSGGRLALAVLYMASVLSGACWEGLARCGRGRAGLSRRASARWTRLHLDAVRHLTDGEVSADAFRRNGQ